MLKNIVRPEEEKIVEHVVEFYYEDGQGGYSFPCDENGKPDFDDMTEGAIKNYHMCMDNPQKFGSYNKMRTRVRYFKPSSYGTCHCGNTVYFENEYMGACQCDKCGQWYNLFGQELLPPEQWGEY
ncbi:hypothetical protein [Anaerovibrio sp. RM50]|uniref:hypothetical protein n=1 Tax=Anaerovibrio sp. RM50 TaxID=1200557 RepID=UPI00048780D0|nr:hypothetical protein [Anaerovibrio sp. RM50]